jgi:hypothetical protein
MRIGRQAASDTPSTINAFPNNVNLPVQWPVVAICRRGQVVEKLSRGERSAVVSHLVVKLEQVECRFHVIRPYGRAQEQAMQPRGRSPEATKARSMCGGEPPKQRAPRPQSRERQAPWCRSRLNPAGRRRIAAGRLERADLRVRCTHRPDRPRAPRSARAVSRSYFPSHGAYDRSSRPESGRFGHGHTDLGFLSRSTSIDS